MPPPPVLNVRARDGTKLRVPLGRQPVTLGRADTCDVVLRDDGEVSREHAQIWVDERGQVVVRDCGSKNGTRVDGGDSFRDEAHAAFRTIVIGEYEIRVHGVRTLAAPTGPDVRFVPDAPTQVDGVGCGG